MSFYQLNDFRKQYRNNFELILIFRLTNEISHQLGLDEQSVESSIHHQSGDQLLQKLLIQSVEAAQGITVGIATTITVRYCIINHLVFKNWVLCQII